MTPPPGLSGWSDVSEPDRVSPRMMPSRGLPALWSRAGSETPLHPGKPGGGGARVGSLLVMKHRSTRTSRVGAIPAALLCRYQWGKPVASKQVSVLDLSLSQTERKTPCVDGYQSS